MAFKPYLTYGEYLELSGKVSEDAFPALVRQAQRWLDVFTFNRVKKMTVVPDEVKDVLVVFIDKLDSHAEVDDAGKVLSSYSNGVEKLEYRKVYESELKKDLRLYAYAWLPEYLVNRSVYFDDTEYLQSESDNP